MLENFDFSFEKTPFLVGLWGEVSEVLAASDISRMRAEAPSSIDVRMAAGAAGVSWVGVASSVVVSSIVGATNGALCTAEADST